MYLRFLSIKNFRSLVDVQLDGIQNFNILIGRNNVGKSSIFGALLFIKDVINDNNPDWENARTERNSERRLEFILKFEPNQCERVEFIKQITLDQVRQNQILESSFFRSVEFSFKSSSNTQNYLHLNYTKLMAEDETEALFQQISGDDIGSAAAHKVIDFEQVSKWAKGQLSLSVMR